MTFTTILDWVGAFLISVGGGAALVWAFSSWLAKVWANKILEKDRAKYQEQIEILRMMGQEALERLRGQTEKELFIHRLQFEKEFEIYFGLWAKFHFLKLKVLDLQPLADLLRKGKVDDDNLQLRKEAFDQAFHSLHREAYSFRPFYAPDIFVTLTEILDYSFDIADTGVKKSDRSPTITNVEEYFKFFSSLDDYSEQLCKGIRNRIWQIPPIAGASE